MKKILGSVGVLAVVGALVLGATGAFFSDTETSTGNTFTAGAIDLKVDNTCYYNKIADGVPNCPTDGDIVTSWQQTDLGPTHKFFWFKDVKPGDFGENTVSLHVLNNDAWGRLVIDAPIETENLCTEPEKQVDNTCSDPDGELRENTYFEVWLDQGQTPGFQNGSQPSQPDPGEGDNIRNHDEPILITRGTIDQIGEIWYLSQGLATVRSALANVCTPVNPDGDGNTNYGVCHGLATDGRLVGSATYYFGISWDVPSLVGNDTQTDGMTIDMTVEAVQHRNNPNPWNS